MLKKEMALKFLHRRARPSSTKSRAASSAKPKPRRASTTPTSPRSPTSAAGTSDGLLYLVPCRSSCRGSRSRSSSARAASAGRCPSSACCTSSARSCARSSTRIKAASSIAISSPTNIMAITRDGERDVVKLLDFGIAKMTEAPDGSGGSGGTPSGQALTQAGVVFGTPEYLSPEQAMGEEADRRADLYSAGIVLYEMLTGKRPFEAPSKVTIVSMHLTQKAMPVTEAAPAAGVPKWLERVVEHAMAKKRDERYSDAGPFLQGARLVAADRRQPTVRRARKPVAAGRRLAIPRAARARSRGPFSARLRRRRPGAGGRARRHRRRHASLGRPASGAGGDGRGRCNVPSLLLARGELRRPRCVTAIAVATSGDRRACVSILFGQPRLCPGRARARARRLSRRHRPRRRLRRRDAVLRANVRAMLDRRNEGPAAVALLADDIGKPALPDLVACAKSCRDERARRKAAEAAVKIGGAKLIADEGKPADEAGDEVLERLRSGKSCKEQHRPPRLRASLSAAATSAISTACARRAIAAAAFSASSRLQRPHAYAISTPASGRLQEGDK